MQVKDALSLAARYVLLLILPLGNLWLIYAIFTPLTLYPSAWIIGLFMNVKVISPNLIELPGTTIRLIPACIAGAAYYLLLILNLTTPMKIRQRMNSIAFLLVSFLALNIVRICLFTWLIDSNWFDVAHMATWYFGSTIMLVAIWFVNVKLFKIESIPFLSDAIKISKDIKKGIK